MIGAILTHHNAPLELLDLTPRPLQRGQVLVRIRMTGICGSQLHETTGRKDGERPMPRLLGHEASADVLECGEEVTRVSPGDLVVCHWRKAQGIDAEPPVYDSVRGEIRAGPIATFAEQAVISENRLTPIACWTSYENIDMDLAMMGCRLSTALAMVEHEIKPQFGETALVMGAGPLGWCIARALKEAGCPWVCLVDRTPKPFQMCEGITLLDSTAPLKNSSVKFTIIVDTTGNQEAIDTAETCFSGDDKFILAGTMPQQMNQHIRSNGGGFNPRDITRYLDRTRGWGREIVTHKFPLLRINNGIETARTGCCGAVMIQP